MTILADPAARSGGAAPTGWVVGVDTHTDTHAAVLVDRLGAVRAQTEVAADPAGYTQLQHWAAAHCPVGQPLLWAVEGTRSHGHGLTRHLQTGGQWVVEAPKPPAGRRRGRGKSDTLDAAHAARAVLATDRHAHPRADGPREALRLLVTTRRHYTDVRTATVNLFKSLLLGAGPLRESLRAHRTATQIRLVLAAPTDPTADLETRIRTAQLRIQARTITELDTLLTDNLKQLRTLVTQQCPHLLDQPGVGPVTAATLLTAWSHHGRLRSEAAFAALAGTNPLPASSGRVQRHRLNRGGDRHLNAALHTITTARRRMHHPPTTAYITRRTTEGLTPNEILRCLKRYTTRHLYRLMNATATT